MERVLLAATEGEALCVWAAAAVVSGFVAAHIRATDNPGDLWASGSGFVVGLLFGPLGVIVAALRPPSPAEGARRAVEIERRMARLREAAAQQEAAWRARQREAAQTPTAAEEIEFRHWRAAGDK